MFLGVYEMTQEQYQLVRLQNPSTPRGTTNPVNNVSWDNAVEFCNTLSRLPEEEEASRVYRLPTEAEWEYACRVGTTTAYSFGEDESQFGDYGWIGDNAGRKPHPVGQKLPNPWGLYDMHGNVFEWCSDWYRAFSPSGSVTDPAGPSSGPIRVPCGGSWFRIAEHCRSAFRSGVFSGLSNRDRGFRVALSSSGQ